VTTQQAEGTMTTDKEVVQFAVRALHDFGLFDEFKSRSPNAREECLRWIAAADGERAQECRVSQMLDELASHRPLPFSA
jgi:hypothetical protein